MYDTRNSGHHGGTPINPQSQPFADAVKAYLGPDADRAGLFFGTDSLGDITSIDLVGLAKGGLRPDELAIIHKLDQLAGRLQDPSKGCSVSYRSPEIAQMKRTLARMVMGP